MTQMQPRRRHAHPSAAAPRTRWETWAIAATAAGLVVVIPLIVWLATRPDPPRVEPVAAAPTTHTTTPAATTPPPAGPVTTLTPRSEPYPVGVGAGAVAPGTTYVSSGPNKPDGACYWARLRGNTHTQADIIDDSGHAPYRFKVGPRDWGVQVLGCTFVKTG